MLSLVFVAATSSLPLSPLPQQVWAHGSGVELYTDWVIATNTELGSQLQAAIELQQFIADLGIGTLAIVNSSGISTQYGCLPNGTLACKYIGFGTADDPKLAEEALARNVSIPVGRGDEAYGLTVDDGAGRGRAILVMGAGPRGAYWGMQASSSTRHPTPRARPSNSPPPAPPPCHHSQTLKQLLNSSAATRFRLPGICILDWPERAVRGALLNNLGRKNLDPSFLPRVEYMVAHKMNFAFLEVAINPYDETNWNFLYQMQQTLERRHVQMVVQLPGGLAVPGHPETSEGVWAKDVPFTVSASGELVPQQPAVLPLANGGFDGGFQGWEVYGSEPPGRSRWTEDASVSRFAGRSSVRCDVDAAGATVSARLLSNAVAVQANRTYQLSLCSQHAQCRHALLCQGPGAELSASPPSPPSHPPSTVTSPCTPRAHGRGLSE